MWTAIGGWTLAMGLVACGGGDGSGTEGSGASDGGTGTGSSSSSSSTGSGTSTGSSSSEECGPSSVNQDDPCEVCIAQSCTSEALACCQAPGCLDVVYCAAETGCNGIECYADDKCKAEIDAAGLDVAQSQAQTLGDCAIANCEMECMSKVGG